MKTKNINQKAVNDVLIEELPKADTINNSDLFVLQKLNGETEATSIQELTRKIQDGGTSYGEDLGQILFFTSKTQNPNMHAMDGTIGTKAEYPEFYNFLLTLTTIEKQFWALNETDETFFFKSLNNKFLKITGGSITTEGSSSSYVVDHTHQVLGSYLDNFWINPQTGTKPSGARRVLVERATGEAIQKTSVALGTGSSTTPISDNIAPSVLLYAYVVTKNLNRASSSLYIKSDGTVAMNNDYIPTDPLDVATKKYIDNKFLNYEIPLSFSINDIGKRVPYYKNAETNPVLIALDGTKYLISDYPDFNYENQEGFTNDGVYFWFKNIELEVKNFQNDIQPNSEWFRIPLFYGIIGGNLAGNFEFNSKMIYNFLMSPQGAPYLFTNPNDNQGFTILDASTYRIRANYNNWGTQTFFTNLNTVYKFKMALPSINDNPTNPFSIGITNSGASSAFALGISGEVSYLKIQPDYMVAKIQQLGSATGGGDLKADRSVLLTGAGTFNTKQIVSMDDLKDTNIIVGSGVRALITLDTKLNEVDNNILTITNNIGSVNISSLQNQVNTNTTDIATLQNSMATKRKTLFNRKFSVNTAGTINQNGGTIRLLDLLANNGTNTNGFEVNNNSYIFTSGTNAFIQEKILYSDLIDSSLTITVRFKRNGAFGNTTLDFQLLRVIDNSVVEGVSENNTSSTAQEFSMKINTTLYDINDPYVLNGYYFRITNRSNTNFAYDSIELKITRTMDYGY